MFGADKDLSTFSGVLPIIIIVKNGISDHRRVSMSESRSQNSKNASALHLRTFCTLPLHFRALALAFFEADMAQR